MMIVNKRTRLLALMVSLSFLVALGFAQSSINGIQLTYKRDPRQVDPTRGIAPWVQGPGYGGATAQDTVEVRAEGIDTRGKVVKIAPQWTPSDPEMVTVSPSQGDDVKITVHRAGESTLKVTYQAFSMELVVKAHKNNFLVFEITPVSAPKPAARPAAEAPLVLKSKGDVSYAAGMSLAKALQEQSVEVDEDSLIQGITDTLSGSKTRMTEEQALAALAGLYTDQRIVEEGLNRTAVGEKNKREGEAFLAENKKKEGVVTLPSGLQYKIIKAGEGEKPGANDVVDLQYRGTFIDGREFDNTFGRAIVTFPLNAVIKGWQEALQLMPVGSQWQLFVPSELAYGERGAGGGGGRRAGGPRPQTVGPNATLVFELELLGLEPAGASSPAADARAQNAGPTPDTLTPEMVEQLRQVIQAAEESKTKPEQR